MGFVEKENNMGEKTACRARRPRRVMVISFDAVGKEDLPLLKSLPNFAGLAANGSLCTEVKSVYPSITYPAHTSIITGRMPKNHGIINNTQIQPKRPTPDWFWQRKFVKGTTLYDEAKKAGWKTAGLLWPVIARSKMDWYVPEVMANRPWENQVIANALNGPLFYQLELNRKFGHLRDGIRQPALDNFVHASALYTIRKYRPDLFLLHLTDVDTNRHIYGVHHPKAEAAIRRQDERLGEIIAALKETGDMEETTVIVLGDHYQKDTKKIVYLNYLLREKGCLTTEGEKITSYKALAKTCDGSAYLYLNPRMKEAEAAVLKKELEALIRETAEKEEYGIGRIFTAEEAGAMGADPDCFLMLEAAEGYYFLDEFEVPFKGVEEEKKHKMRGTHGYLPDGKDYGTFFLAAGCGIVPGQEVSREIRLWDEGVTMAELMGLDLGETDGTVIKEILL